MPLPAVYRPPTVGSLDDMSVAIDGWTGGAVDSQGTQWRLNKFDGWWGSAPLRLSLQDRPLDHGAFDGPSFYSPRVMTLEGLAISPDRTTQLLARDIVASVCAAPASLTAMVVTEPGRPTRRCMVRQSGDVKVADLTDTMCRWSMVLVAPDPRRYDDTETVIVLSPPTGALGGITVPLTVPFTISTTGMSTSSATATNAGTLATRPIVEFAGPLVDPQIANVGAGRSLSMTITLAAGDILTADFDRRTLLLNGSASRSNTLTASAAWWELDPGGNDLTFAAGGGDGTATVRYRSAWL